MDEKLNQLLHQLPQPLVIEVMTYALEIMQGHNCQSVTRAVCTALNAEEFVTENGPRWKLPTPDQIKQDFYYKEG